MKLKSMLTAAFLLLLSCNSMSFAQGKLSKKDFVESDWAEIDKILSDVKNRQKQGSIVCSPEQCWKYVPGSLRSYPSGIKRAYINIQDLKDGQMLRAFYAADCYHGKLGIGDPKDPIYPGSYGEKIFNYMCKARPVK